MSAAAHYRRDIDGLRALAVIAVVVFHAFPAASPGGFVGVDVFFVISGYLITGVILSDLRAGTFTIRNFYARRIRRIFPALAAVLITCLAFGWLTLLPNEYDRLGQHVSGGSGFVVNFLLWRESGYFDAAAELKPLLHLWSLGIEEQFYLVWPLMLAAASRFRRSPLVIVVVPVILLSFAWNIRSVHHDAVADFYSPLSRLWELAIGGALACMPKQLGSEAARHAASVIGLVLVIATTFLVNNGTAFPGWWATLPVLGTALVIAAGPDALPNRTVLSCRPAVWIGLISYPLYLWHWPALSFMRILTSGVPSLSLRIIAVIASVLAAWLTYRVIERPLRFGTKAKRPAVVIALAAAMAVLLALGLVVHSLRGIPSRMPPQLRIVASPDYDFTTDARVDRCWLVPQAPADGYAAGCTDPPGPAPLVFIWGDSHAARLYPGIRAAVPGLRLAEYARASCAPIFDHVFPECVASNTFILEKIRGTKPAMVVLFAAWGQHSTSWRRDDPVLAALQHTVDEVHALGVPQILIIGPAPAWEDTLPRVLINASWRDPFGKLPQRTRYGLNPAIEPIDAAMPQALELPPGARYVSAWQLLCDATGCMTYVDETVDGLVQYDAGHLTTAGATFVARHLPLPR